MKLGSEKDFVKVYESFALVKKEIIRLSRMVEGVLAISSMQELSHSNTEINVRDVIYGSVEAYRALSEKRSNTLRLTVTDTLPKISVGAEALVQMITNLLTNANAHTENGEISVLCECDRAGATLKISITDNSAGIPPDLLPKVFERGVTGSSGSGYRLSICRELARSNGGDVTVEST